MVAVASIYRNYVRSGMCILYEEEYAPAFTLYFDRLYGRGYGGGINLEFIDTSH